MDDITFRQGRVEDVASIASLYQSQTGRVANQERITQHLTNFPSAVAHAENELVAFCYGLRFGPDVLELGNLFVSRPWRSRGIGTKVVGLFEQLAIKDWAAVVLINSRLYPSIEPTKPAVPFYERLGYRVLLSTGPTTVLGKVLRPGP